MTRADRAPDAGVRRASPHDARRDARSEAWPSGKAAPCYGVGASSASAGSSPAASVPFRPVAQWKRAVGFEPTCRPFESGRGVSHDRPRVAQLRRAPLLQRGGWGFESLAADTPSKLSRQSSRLVSGRLSVRSRPGALHPLVAQHGRGIRLRPGPVVVRIHAGGLTVRRRPMAGRPAVTRRTLVRPQPSQCFPRSSNGRIFGSEPKDAWFESRPRSSIIRTRTWRPSGFQHRRRGFDSFRPCSHAPVV